MATYKVPQDVEAEDKLLGPFSFRQFVYLVIAVIAGGLAYFLGRLFLPLFIIPLPIAILFLVLSLPLKKDQPMEIYLGAILSFYLKPRLKIWQQDGIENIVEMTNELADKDLVSLRDLTNEQAQERLSFLSQVVDTEGWSIRGVNNTTFQDTIVAEAKQTEDIHEENSEVIKSFDQMINDSDHKRRAIILNKLNSKSGVSHFSDVTEVQTPIINNVRPLDNPPLPQPQPKLVDTASVAGSDTPSAVPLQPMPLSQPRVQPVSKYPNQPELYPTFEPAPGPMINPTIPELTEVPNSELVPEPEIDKADIINLATNKDLTIETIAAEANRIKDRNKRLLGGQEEVVISLR